MSCWMSADLRHETLPFTSDEGFNRSPRHVLLSYAAVNWNNFNASNHSFSIYSRHSEQHTADAFKHTYPSQKYFKIYMLSETIQSP